MLRFVLHECRDGFSWRGRRRSFHIDGPKTERHRNQQRSRDRCKESGGQDYQKQSGEYGRMCKVEDSHRDKIEQLP